MIMPIAANETIIKAKAVGKFGIMGVDGYKYQTFNHLKTGATKEGLVQFMLALSELLTDGMSISEIHRVVESRVIEDDE
jgi:hypothetical protein